MYAHNVNLNRLMQDTTPDVPAFFERDSDSCLLPTPATNRVNAAPSPYIQPAPGVLQGLDA